MSERLSAREDERVVAPEQASIARPLVSLTDMRDYTDRSARAGERTEAGPRDQTPVTLDFGSMETLYGKEAGGSPDNVVAVRFRAEETLRRPPTSAAELPRLRTELSQEIGRMPREMQNDFRASMQVLEARTPPCSREQIAGVYDATLRLLRNQGGRSPLSEGERQMLATGILDNAARPREIDQGAHATCNLTTLQERLNTLHPDRAAALAAEVGLTGSYTGTGGFRATIDRGSLRPDAEARTLPSAGDGLRNYASQIFDVAVMNDYFQRFHPDIRYVQRDRTTAAEPRGMSATGEGVLQSPNDRVSQESARRARIFNGLDMRQISEIGDGLGLQRGYLIGHARDSDVRPQFGVTPVNSAAELRDAIARARTTNNFPVIVGVDVSGPMFQGGTGRGGHVVSIVGYDPVRQTVQISNQWGRKNDLQNVPIEQVFRSMLPTPRR